MMMTAHSTADLFKPITVYKFLKSFLFLCDGFCDSSREKVSGMAALSFPVFWKSKKWKEPA